MDEETFGMMGVQYNDQEGGVYENDIKATEKVEEKDKLEVNDLRAKNIQANGETLEEML